MFAGIDSSHVVELLNQGITKTQVAELLGVTKQTIEYHAKKMGWRSPHQVAMDQIPWTSLDDDDKRATPYRMVVLHLEYQAMGGEAMSPEKLRRLRSWYENKIFEFDTVVEYDPKIPPAPGQRFGHWRYAPREEKDGDLIIRQNRYTKLNDAQKEWFRLPKRLPEVDD